MLTKDSVMQRRSIRKFSAKAVSVEIIKEILEAGRAAPSAKNRQPWKFIVFGGERKDELLSCMERGIAREEEKPLLPESAKGIADCRNTLWIMKEAPITVVILNTNGKSPFEEINSDDRITEICDTLSIGASVENILLRAAELGIGTLWIANTCYAYPEITEYLNTDFQLVGAVAMGYAEEKPSARPRKPIEDIIEFRM